MDIDWQQAVALAFVVLAAGHVGWRAWRRLLGNSVCAACVGCGARKSQQAAQRGTIVPIEALTQANSPIRDSDAAQLR
jgi:hypothetical protein